MLGDGRALCERTEVRAAHEAKGHFSFVRNSARSIVCFLQVSALSSGEMLRIKSPVSGFVLAFFCPGTLLRCVR